MSFKNTTQYAHTLLGGKKHGLSTTSLSSTTSTTDENTRIGTEKSRVVNRHHEEQRVTKKQIPSLPTMHQRNGSSSGSVTMFAVVIAVAFVAFTSSASAFVPPSSTSTNSVLLAANSRSSASATQFRRTSFSAPQKSSSTLYTTSLQAAPVPNPFKKLPWNVEKEQRRKARKLRLDRSALHRELGIAEDATYEEITAATDALIAAADGDLKRKIKIEVAKDKILQIRLNERLAGLSDVSTEVRAQSSYEVSGYV